MIEVFNKKLLGWLEKMEIVHFMSVSDKREFKDLDIALVEGTISSERDKREVEEIRKQSKILIAMGNCAITALPSGQRNNFDAEKKMEIQNDLDTYDFLPKCLALDEVVKVDDEIIGCPIDEKKFVEVFEKYLG
jgi:coenzyme F420-reducing hydrogenase gamma subunit